MCYVSYDKITTRCLHYAVIGEQISVQSTNCDNMQTNVCIEFTIQVCTYMNEQTYSTMYKIQLWYNRISSFECVKAMFNEQTEK